MKRLAVSITLLICFIAMSFASSGAISKNQMRNLITSSSNGTLGFYYKGKIQIMPQYDEIILLGSNRPCFFGKIDNQWFLVDVWNRPLISKSFREIQTYTEISQETNRTVTLDSIYIVGRGTVLTPQKITYDRRAFEITNSTPAVLVVKQINSMSNKEGWTFLTFDGTPLTSDYYDYASLFKQLSDNKNRNHIYLASVMRDNLWGAIDLYGREIIPLKYKSPITSKNKELKKILKNDYSFFDKSRINELENLVPEEGVNTLLWVEDSISGVRIEKVGGNIINKNKANGKAKKKKQNKPQYSPVSYRLLINDTIVLEQIEEIDTHQNPFIRIKKNGKWGIYQAGIGMIFPCEFTSIQPFDQFGLSDAILFDGTEIKISAYGAYSSIGPNIEELYQKYNDITEKNNYEISGPIYEELLEMLELYDDPYIRFQCQPKEMLEYFNMRREREDPDFAKYLSEQREKKRLEEERIRKEKEQERLNKKSDGGIWGLLGDIASLAGDIIETTGNITGKVSTTSTGTTLSSLGKSVSDIARGSDMTSKSFSSFQEEPTSLRNEVAKNKTNNLQIESQIKALDDRIKHNREQAANLLKKRNDVKYNLQKDLQQSTSKSKLSNIKMNNVYTNIRKQANNNTVNTVASRNNLSSIDTQIERLNNEWGELLQNRVSLLQQLGDSYEVNVTSVSQNKTKEDYQRDYDMYADLAKRIFTSLKNTGSYSISKDGKDYEANNNLSTANSTLKQQLVRYQTKMKHIRQNALAKKIMLTKSEYETVTIKW